MRYTILPEARKEVLRRLQDLNYRYHEEEVAAELVGGKGRPVKKARGRKQAEEEQGPELDF